MMNTGTAAAASTEDAPPARDTQPQSTFSNEYRSPSTSFVSSQTQFLGVMNLTRATLNACIDAFLTKLEHFLPLSCTAPIFKLRYEAFLRHYDGLEPMGEVEPASELFVLAVACRGCNNTASPTRFALSEAFLDRFIHQVNAQSATQLCTLDSIEAITLLSDMLNQRPRNPVLPQPGQDYPHHPTFLLGEILGRNTCIALSLSIQLNIELSGLSAQESARRRFLFVMIFLHDAFESAEACQLYRIHDEDVGWEFGIIAGSVRSTHHHEYARSAYSLALLARRIGRETMSAKAKMKGVEPETVVELLVSLQTWYNGLDASLQFDWDVESSISVEDIIQEETNATTNADGIAYSSRALLSRRAFLLVIYLSLYLNLWSAITEVGYKKTPSMTVDAVSASNVLEENMFRSCFQMAALVKHCHELDLVHDSPRNLFYTPSAWTLWITRQVSTVARSSNKDSSLSSSPLDMKRLWLACQSFIDCVRATRSHRDSAMLSESLQKMVDQAFALEQQNRQTYSSTASKKRGRKKEIVGLEEENNPLAPSKASPATLNVDPMASTSSSGNSPSAINGMLGDLDSSEDILWSKLLPDWDALNAVSAEVQQFLADIGFEMPDQASW